MRLEPVKWWKNEFVGSNPTRWRNEIWTHNCKKKHPTELLWVQLGTTWRRSRDLFNSEHRACSKCDASTQNKLCIRTNAAHLHCRVICLLCPLHSISANALRLRLFSFAVSLAVTGFGNDVARAYTICAKSRKTATKKHSFQSAWFAWRRSRDLNPGYDSLVLLP